MDKVGGDAFSGYVEKGKYFISLGDGEEYKEVNQITWVISYSFTVMIILSSFIFALSSFLGMLIYGIIPKWKKIFGF